MLGQCLGEQGGFMGGIEVGAWAPLLLPAHSCAPIWHLHRRFHLNKASFALKEMPRAPVTTAPPSSHPQGSWPPTPGLAKAFGWPQVPQLLWRSTSLLTKGWEPGFGFGSEVLVPSAWAVGALQRLWLSWGRQRRFSKSLRKWLVSSSDLICLFAWLMVETGSYLLLPLRWLEASLSAVCCVSEASRSLCTQSCWGNYKSGGPELRAVKKEGRSQRKIFTVASALTGGAGKCFWEVGL